MVIKAFFDIRDNEVFDMCFYVHKVVGYSKVVLIDGNLASCKLNSIFKKISEEFVLIHVMRKFDNVRLIIGDSYITGEKDCKSTIFSPANENVDLSLEIGKYKCKLMVNMDERVLSFPKCAAFDYPVTPSVVEIEKYFHVNACEFNWFKCCSDPRTTQTVKWIEVATSFAYIPRKEDVGHFLKFQCTPKTTKGKAKSMVAVATSPVIRGEPKPEHLPSFHRCTYTEKNLDGCNFRVVSYNVLADMYVKKSEERGENTHCPYYATDSTYRMDLILKELADYNPDIICLQELDEYAYVNMFKNTFQKRGYVGIYCLKHPRTYYGLACFVRRVKFRVCETSYILYPKEMFSKNPVFNYLYVEVSKSPRYANAFKRSQNSILCVVLENVADSTKYVVVGNTQLLSSEENTHIRLMQTSMAVEYIHFLVGKYKKGEPNVQVSSLLCGDLNSLPNSSVYKFLSNGHLPEDCLDWASKPDEEFEGMALLHDLGLKSAYTDFPYTNYATDFKGCLDYIFYSSDSIELIQSVPIPPEEVLAAQIALPSLRFPSDHLALVADFKWQLEDIASGLSNTLHIRAGSETRDALASKPSGWRGRKRRGGRGRNAGNTYD